MAAAERIIEPVGIVRSSRAQRIQSEDYEPKLARCRLLLSDIPWRSQALRPKPMLSRARDPRNSCENGMSEFETGMQGKRNVYTSVYGRKKRENRPSLTLQTGIVAYRLPVSRQKSANFPYCVCTILVQSELNVRGVCVRNGAQSGGEDV